MMCRRKLNEWGQIIMSLLFLVSGAGAAAQDCENVLGSIHFKPNAVHASDSLFGLGDLALTYPSGAMCDGVSSVIDSFPCFTDGKHVIGTCVNNPAYLNYEDHEEFKDIDVPMYVVTCAGEAMSKLFEYSVYCAKPGTAYKVKFKLWNIMSLDGEVGSAWPTYAGYAPYDLVVGVPKPYGSGMEATKLTPQDESKEFEFEGVVGENESSITFGIWTGYNCVKNCVLGISDIEIIGCLNPRIKSGQGLKVCEGEQTPLTLDREYNAKSYKWEKSTNGGSSWTTISTSKTALEEITENASYRCTVDGAVSNVLEIEKETCCEVNGKPASRKTVFLEDFGYFKTSRVYVDKDGNESTLPKGNVDFRVDTRFDIPETTFDAKGQVNDGSYAVVVPTENGYALEGNGQYATWMNGVTTDHSSTIDGRDNSACLFINVTEGYKGPIFEDRIDGVCKNKELTFECYIANMSGADMNPIVTIKLLKTDGTPITGATMTTEATKGSGWILCKIPDVITTESSIILQVIADCGGNCNNGQFWSKGNDLALDDIKFMTCSPPAISAYLNMETLSLDTTVCEDVKLKIQMPVSKLLDDYFGGNQVYVLQASDDGKKWKHLMSSTESTINFNSDELRALYEEAEVIYARVIVASPSAALEFEKDPNMADADSDCNDYSISDPFTITIDCPSCTSSAELEILMDGEKVRKTINLCKGEEVILSGNDLTTTDAKGNEYANFNTYWHFGEKEKAKDEGVAKPSDIVVSWDDANTLGEDGVLEVTLTSEDADYPGYTDCTQSVTITVKANPVPNDTIEYPKPFCEGKAGELSLGIDGMTIEWFEDADTTSSLGSNVANIKEIIEGNKGNNAAPYEYWYAMTDKETKCKGEVHKLVVDIREVPKAPEDVEIQMVVTGKDEALEHEDLVSTEEKTLIWYYNGCDGCAMSPKIDCRNPGEYSFKIAYKSGECVSEEATVSVVVTAAPKPEYKKIDLCEGDALEVASRVVLKDDTKYVLNWYDDANKSNKINAPLLEDAAPGAYTFYVTQQGTEEPKPESDVLEFTINVYGVKPPKTEDLDYCAEETAKPFEATAVKDMNNFYGADGFIWSLEGTDLAEDFTPSTTSGATTTFSVRQTFTTPISGKVCEGDNTDFDVTVTKVEPLSGTFNVSYVHADGEADGSFHKNLITQDPNVVNIPTDENSSVVWSADNSVFNSSVPIPLYQEAVAGTVQEQNFYAKHVVKVSSTKTCEAKSQEVTVLITSTPVPIVHPMTYCEDHVFAANDAEDLVDLNSNNGDFDTTGFDIYWFTNKETANQCAGNGTVTGNIGGAPNLGALTIDFGEESKVVQEFYVVQGNLSVTPAQISAPNTLPITFYKKPEIIVENVPAVCDKTIDLTSPNVWHAAAGVEVTAEYNSANGSLSTATASAIKESGTYTINAYIMAGTDVCHAEPKDVVVDVQHLEIDVTAPTTTCPNSMAELLLTTTYTYNDDPSLPAHSATFTYTDNGGSNVSNSVNLTSVTKIKTEKLMGEAGKPFTMDLTVEAGACKETWSDIISLGDGPVSGQIVFTETENALSNSGYPINAVDKRKGTNIYYSCGGDVKIDITDLTKTETGADWYLDENLTIPATGKSGEVVTASVASGSETYYVRYTNECDAFIAIQIVAEPITVKLTDAGADAAVSLCEGEAFKREVKVKCVSNTINKVWYKDNAKQNNITNEINFSKLDKAQHEGFYAFKATNKGCSDSIDVVDLKVKQYIKFEPTDYETFNKQKAYIVTAGEDIDIPLSFTVPANTADVTVNWQDATSGTSGTGSTDKYTITSIDADHKIHIVASGADYCEASDDVVVLKDAKIRVSVDIDNAMCLRDNKKLTVDTTGTGRGVRGPITLEVIAVPTNGTTAQVKGLITGIDGLSTKEVSPTSDTRYIATISYNGSTEQADAEIKVYSYIVKAVGQKVCAGKTVDLEATVTPATATLTWYDNDRTTVIGDGTTVSVAPPFEVYDNSTSYKRRYYINASSSDVDCESMFSVDVTVYKPLDEGSISDTTICEGGFVRIDAGSYSATKYEWTSSNSPVSTSGRFKNDSPTEDVVYTVNMSRGECEATAHSTVTVSKRPVVASIDSVGHRDRQVIMDESYGKAPYFLSVDGGEFASNNMITDLSYTNHLLTIIDAVGCKSDTTFIVTAPPVHIPSMFSPNKDGIGDTWMPNGIKETYPEAEFTIYDRWGKVIATFRGEDDGWDGTYNGNPMPAADYWYEVHIREIDQTYTGHFTLLRR